MFLPEFDTNEEVLLQEDIGYIPDPTLTLNVKAGPPPPCTWDMDLRKFDKRMEETGFTRSCSQPITDADGDCAIWAILDQINNDGTEDPKYKTHESIKFRYR